MGLTVINTAREKITKLESISTEINQKLNTERKKTGKKTKHQWVVGILKVVLQLIDVLLIICLTESLKKKVLAKH